MRNHKSKRTLSWALIAALASLFVLGTSSTASAQDDSEVKKKVRVMVKKHVQCEGDDCEDASANVWVGEDGSTHTLHAGQGTRVMFVGGNDDGESGHGEGGHLVREFIVKGSGEPSTSGNHTWVSANGDHSIFSTGGGGFLGVQLVELTDALRDRFDVAAGVGVMVSEVVAGSPAEQAGITAGDVIVAVDGETVSGASSLTRKVSSLEEGENVAFEISSDGQSRTVNATLAKREGGMAMRRSLSLPGTGGNVMKFRTHGAGDGNVFVEDCDEEGDGCDVEMIIERVVGEHGGAHVIDLEGVDFGGLDCGDGDSCEIEVTCEEGGCVCVVDGDEVACEGLGE